MLLETLTGYTLIQNFMEVTHRIPKSLPPAPILGRLFPVYTPTPTSWRSVLILSYYLHLCHPSGLFPSRYPNQTELIINYFITHYQFTLLHFTYCPTFYLSLSLTVPQQFPAHTHTLYNAHCIHLQPRAQIAVHFSHNSLLYTFRQFSVCRHATQLYWYSTVRCDCWGVALFFIIYLFSLFISE
jgi:hypothetical protein